MFDFCPYDLWDITVPVTFVKNTIQMNVATVQLSEYEIERNKPMPSFNHGLVQGNLITLLNNIGKKRFDVVSELSLDLAAWPSVPDISVYPKKPYDAKNDIIKMPEPPICAIEILSPTQAFNDLIVKAIGYFDHGVKSCWIVLPALKNIYVFTNADDYEIYRTTDTLTDTALDISFPVSEVFE